MELANMITGGTMNVTTTPQPLTGNLPCNGVLVQAAPSNSVDVRIGGPLEQPLWLAAGQPLTIPVTNANLVYVMTDSGSASVGFVGLL